MAQSSIITGQYVELTQTPASVGDRLIGAIIDLAVLGSYFVAVILTFGRYLDPYSYKTGDVSIILIYVLIFFPVILYFPACEILARGQSLGKMAMKTRVVTIDGNAPSVGSCLLRWLLYPIDTFLTGFLGVVFITFGKYRQRLGDLAAGTIVIKTTSTQYDFYRMTDYNYVQQGYEPTYPEAANLTIKQVDVITHTLYNTNSNRYNELVYKLAVQVQQFLGVPIAENTYADVFLKTVLNDFYYYTSSIEV